MSSCGSLVFTTLKSVFDHLCHVVEYEKLDATHQSFTLVFLYVLRRTSRLQTYGEKQDVEIRLNDIFSFRLPSLVEEQLR